MIDRSHRRRLGAFMLFGSRGILPLCETVDLVIEQQDIQVKITAQNVQQMIAADREAVAVAGDDPHLQVRIGHLQTGSDGRRPAMDRVHPISFHVIGKTRGATNTGNDGHLVFIQAKLGKDVLNLFEDGVISAAGAPAHFLVGGEVLRSELDIVGRFSCIYFPGHCSDF